MEQKIDAEGGLRTPPLESAGKLWRLPPSAGVGSRRVVGLRSGQSARVLVVDDLFENRELLRQMLEDLGCAVVLAEDGLCAIERIRAHVPDIAFLDIRMPGMSGKEVARLAREETRTASVKLVAVSASVLAHEQAEYLKSGFDAFLAKPFRLEELCDCLRRVAHLEFEYEPETARRLTWPADLRQRLVEAATRHSATQLEHGLGELGRRGDPEQRAAEHLRQLALQGDFEAIRVFLDRVTADCVGRSP